MFNSFSAWSTAIHPKSIRPKFHKYQRNPTALIVKQIKCCVVLLAKVRLSQQMNKGGNFILGESVIRHNGLVHLPSQAIEEYQIAAEGKVYLFTGSKSTGGFCTTRQELLLPSKLGHILTETPELLHYEVPAGGHSSPTKGAPVVRLRFRKQEQFNSQKKC